MTVPRVRALWFVLAFCFASSAHAIEAADSVVAAIKGVVWVYDRSSARAEPLLQSSTFAAAYERQSAEIHQRRDEVETFAHSLESSLSGSGNLRQIARVRNQAIAILGADLADPETPQAAVRTLIGCYEAFFRPVLEDAMPADSLRLFDTTLDAFRDLDLAAALKQNLARLRRFEIKYGPGSPTLNPLETVLNFGAQHVPPFLPGKNGISPFELVAAYTSSYATVVDGEATAISAAEVGLRIYNWRYRDTPSSLGQALVPRYWSVIFVMGAREDGALEWPWSRRPRLGPGVSWGDFKVAYLHGEGDEWRVVASRQFQFLPHVF